jgi:hypothetical protein
MPADSSSSMPSPSWAADTRATCSMKPDLGAHIHPELRLLPHPLSDSGGHSSRGVALIIYSLVGRELVAMPTHHRSSQNSSRNPHPYLWASPAEIAYQSQSPPYVTGSHLHKPYDRPFFSSLLRRGRPWLPSPPGLEGGSRRCPNPAKGGKPSRKLG